MAVSQGLTMIPVEILLHIFENVRTENRSQLLPLALVSHDFYHLVMPLLYRSISICLDPQEHHFEPTKALVKRLIVSNTNLLNVIRFVDVYNDDEPLIPSSEHAIFKDPRRLRDQVVLDQLIDVIPRLRNLVSLNWRVCWGIPEALLLSMRQKCPSARLSVGFDSCLVGPDFNTVVELAGPMLHELKIILGYHGDSQETNSKLVWGLKRCPNLKVLYMQLAEASMTQLIDPPEHHLEFQPSDLLPRVSKLSVDERIFTLQNLSSWAKLDGLTQLKEVTLRNHHPLPHLRGCEKTLRSINLIQASGITPGEWGFRHEPGHSSSDIEKGLVEICSRLKCLQTLKVCGTHSTTIPTQALRICGGNLKTLEIHTLSTNRNLAGENPTIQTLETVRQCCPNIATLGVDMNRTNNTWPYEYLTALGTWPNLTDLSLFAEMSTSTNAPHAALLDIDAAHHISSFVLDRKFGKPFQRVTIYRGDDHYKPDGVICREYERRILRAVFHCKRVLRDDLTEVEVVMEGGFSLEDKYHPYV